jgi:Flp pilus assembly protein TadD
VSRRALAVVLGLAIAGAAVYVYAPVRHFDFVSLDDPDYVFENSHIAGGVTRAAIVWAFTNGYVANWHPLTWLSHALDLQLFGVNGGAHHLVNAALHVAGSLLLFAAWLRLTGALGRSAVVALLFAVHPMHVESVAWIAERKDVLSGFFFMLTLWLYASYARKPALITYIAVCISFVLGLMAKSMLVTLPVILLLLDIWPLRRPRRFLEKIPLLLVAAASSVVTFVVQQNAGAVQGLSMLPVGDRISRACVSYLTYVWKALWPAHLAVFYPFSPLPVWQPIAAAVLLVVATIAAFRARKRVPYVFVGWMWFVVMLAPVIGLIQVGTQAWADRYTYLPYVGLFIVVVWGVFDLTKRFAPTVRVALPVTAALVVIALSVSARAQVQHWKDSETLWRHALAVTSNNGYAEAGLGMAYAADGRTDEAIAHLTIAAAMQPTLADVRNDLGRMYARRGDVSAAIEQFSAAIRSSPKYADARHNLGVSLLDQGRLDEAIAQFAEATRLNPTLAEAFDSWGRALLEKGQTVDAKAKLDQALSIDPHLADAHQNLGRLLATEGHVADAVPHFRDAIRDQPGFAEAHYNLGLALATLGERVTAIAEFTEAIRLDPALADLARQEIARIKR